MRDWQKSSFSSGDPNTNCIEIADGSTGLRLRESEDPRAVIRPERVALSALLRRIKSNAQFIG